MFADRSMTIDVVPVVVKAYDRAITSRHIHINQSARSSCSWRRDFVAPTSKNRYYMRAGSIIYFVIYLISTNDILSSIAGVRVLGYRIDIDSYCTAASIRAAVASLSACS